MVRDRVNRVRVSMVRLGLVLGLGFGFGLELWLCLGLISPVNVKGEYVCRRRFCASSFSLNFGESVAFLSFYYV